MAEAECIFCKIAAGEGPAHVLDSDEHTISFLDINPATRGHSLVIPRAHSVDLLDTSDEDLERTMTAAGRLARKLEERLAPDGFNILNACRPAAWQTVFHYHLHVIPRYEDDPLELPWIPRGASAEELASVAARVRGEAA